MRWDRTVGSGIGATLVAELYAELELAENRKRARRASDREGLLVTLDALVADLLVAYDTDPTRFLAYARSRDAYPKSRYRAQGITLTTVQTATDFLATAGYAEHHRGRYDRSANPFGGAGGIGELSRIRATPKLHVRASDFGFEITGISTRQEAEVVRLRGSASREATKPWLEYRDDANTTKMRHELATLNALLGATHITLPGGPRMAPEGTEDNEHPQPEPGDARLYRVFNDGSFERGGRFYGGWWMALSKADRARLLINSEPVVELDYSGLHPRLIYDLAGLSRPLDFEPYSLPGRLGSVPRNIVKTAFLQLLNTTGNIRAKAGMSASLPRGVAWSDVVRAIEQQHQAVSDWFRRGRGVELQALDAKMAASIMYQMAQRNVPCLPVHDSFIVPKAHESILGQVMIATYRWFTTSSVHSATMPRINGWSSPEVMNHVTGYMRAG